MCERARKRDGARGREIRRDSGGTFLGLYPGNVHSDQGSRVEDAAQLTEEGKRGERIKAAAAKPAAQVRPADRQGSVLRQRAGTGGGGGPQEQPPPPCARPLLLRDAFKRMRLEPEHSGCARDAVRCHVPSARSLFPAVSFSVSLSLALSLDLLLRWINTSL